ncbi:glycoside hydrolase family 108 protein [Cloacibacillus evryensis]|uniref:glycoside hydrolase family 108 protein n=1 Tax=Cloacibacillus evryensis TaxID=508460 RepID=UPI002B212337|nr:glycosyl hydrolase 108 family protein [Cloacibacillus evryensis]MEA5034253.1 glycosyl hydrolase 108 family protein [Cloacibacillus evryensis]
MSFQRAIGFTLLWEGGYVNDPLDRGGETNRGITRGTLQHAHKAGLVDHADVKALTKAEAIKIYKANYWDCYDWGRYGEPVDMILFDVCVNHGLGGVAKIVQRACVSCGADVKIDGKWGPKTREALYRLAWANGLYLSKMLIIKRLNYYDKIVEARPEQKKFLKGWCNRTRALAKACGVKV